MSKRQNFPGGMPQTPIACCLWQLVELEFYEIHTRCAVVEIMWDYTLAEVDYEFTRTHTLALLTMLIALTIYVQTSMDMDLLN